MKNLLIITALTLPIGVFAQGNANVQYQQVNYFHQDDNNEIQIQSLQARQKRSNVSDAQGFSADRKVPCADCEAVKIAIKNATHSGGHKKRYYGMKRWSRTAAGKLDMKMKKIFSHRKKVRTSYEICYYWH